MQAVPTQLVAQCQHGAFTYPGGAQHGQKIAFPLFRNPDPHFTHAHEVFDGFIIAFNLNAGKDQGAFFIDILCGAVVSRGYGVADVCLVGLGQHREVVASFIIDHRYEDGVLGASPIASGSVTKAIGDAPSIHPGVWYMTVIHEIQASLAHLVLGGVLERYPKLRIVSAENDAGWLPHFNYRMDHVFDKYGEMWDEISERPSHYVKRQVYATFQDDPVGPATHEIFGDDNYMWASDFPHSDSTFPESRAWIEKNFAGVPDGVRRKIVHDNAVALYGMDV